MKLVVMSVCMVLSTGSLWAQAEAQGGGSIEGRVSNEVTREPVRKAQVTLAPADLTAVTDDGGRFVFRKLAAGTYYLQAQHAEFPVVAAGVTGGHPIAVTLLEGEQKSDVAIPLTPGASISGRILDEAGKPLAGCYAQALEPAPGQPGRLYMVRGSSTDNLGAYRIYGLAKGHYYLAAQCSEMLPASHWFARSGANQDVSKQRYALEFYPDTPEPSGAMRLMAAAGANVEGIDFHLHPTSTVTVRGRLSGDAEALGSNPHVELAPRDPSLSNLARYGGAVDPRTGTFRIEGVPAGAYTLVATAQDAGRVYQAKAPVDIDATAPEPIDLPLLPGATFSGSIEIDGNQPAPPFESLHVRLTPLDAESFGRSPDARVEKDGSFSLAGVLPGRWRLRVEGVNGYVKSLALANQQVHSGVFQAAAGAGGPMHVVLSTKMAQVDGTINGLPPDGANPVSVILTPDDAGNMEPGRLIITSAGNDGRFRAPGLEPGRYRLHAVPAAMAGVFAQNQRARKALEARGTQVEVEAGARVTAQLQMITMEELTLAFEEVE